MWSDPTLAWLRRDVDRGGVVAECLYGRTGRHETNYDAYTGSFPTQPLDMHKYLMAMAIAKHFMRQKHIHSLHTPTYPDQQRPYLGHLLADTPFDRQSVAC